MSFKHILSGDVYNGIAQRDTAVTFILSKVENSSGEELWRTCIKTKAAPIYSQLWQSFAHFPNSVNTGKIILHGDELAKAVCRSPTYMESISEISLVIFSRKKREEVYAAALKAAAESLGVGGSDEEEEEEEEEDDLEAALRLRIKAISSSRQSIMWSIDSPKAVDEDKAKKRAKGKKTEEQIKTRDEKNKTAAEKAAIVPDKTCEKDPTTCLAESFKVVVTKLLTEAASFNLLEKTSQRFCYAADCQKQANKTATAILNQVKGSNQGNQLIQSDPLFFHL
jgi:hypothetical protein